jgi:hypothetical protein
MWKKYDTTRQPTDDNIIRRMRFACWITMATDTHSEYVILIAFPRRQWIHKQPSMSRYTYIACLVHCKTDVTSPAQLRTPIHLKQTHRFTLCEKYTLGSECEEVCCHGTLLSPRTQKKSRDATMEQN